MNLGCIVEGHGEESALPTLIRRIEPSLVVPRPVRVPRTKLTRRDEVQRAVSLAILKAGEDARVLLVLDADDDCPVELHNQLLPWVGERLDRPERAAVVVATLEFEAWFLAGALSLRGVRGLDEQLDPPANPEAIRDAKGWLTRNMSGSRAYRETVDQAALAACLDVGAARDLSPSLDKLCRELSRLARVT